MTRMVALVEDQGELHKRVRDLEGNLSNVEEGVTQATKQMRTLMLERSEGLRGSGAPLRVEVGCRVSPEDQSPTRNPGESSKLRHLQGEPAQRKKVRKESAATQEYEPYQHENEGVEVQGGWAKECEQES